jgi:hypothetical protein
LVHNRPGGGENNPVETYPEPAVSVSAFIANPEQKGRYKRQLKKKEDYVEAARNPA